jgi:putative methyltransferase (TIGR04325 family)
MSDDVGPLQTFRVKQIRLTARLLGIIEEFKGGDRLIQGLAHWPLAAPILNALLGYHRVFDDLPQAVAAAEPYSGGGHLSPEVGTLHLSLSESPRPSDYAALYHMQTAISGWSKIFDLGGNVGNLFYCYKRYLELPPHLLWQVYDLPKWTEEGRRLAGERGEKQLQFTQNWEDASGADLLLVSGSLHFFDPPVYHMVAGLPEKPASILINRSPLIDGSTKATVQDGNNHRTARVLHNRRELIAAFETIGYELIDSWEAAELAFKIVGKPEFSAPSYSGLYFRLKPQV